jgi:cell filamentation protein
MLSAAGAKVDAELVRYPSPDPARPYVYPGTQVLINLFDIGSQAILERVVNTVAGLRGERLAAEPVPGEFDLRHLCAFHHALFQDIFAWAGQVRTVDTERQGQDFTPAADIPASFQRIAGELKGENFLRGLGPDEFPARLAHYYYSLYAVHAFRDGNSRALRHFFAALAAAAAYRLDYSALEPTALLHACRQRYFEDEIGPLRECCQRMASPC